MGSLIVAVLTLFAPVLPPVLAFRFVLVGRSGRGWLMPLAVAGVGIAVIVWSDLVTVSEQSRLFLGAALFLIFGLSTLLTVAACLLGHAARLVAVGLAGKG